MSEQMRVGVIGAGATGAYLAARLADAGIEVTLVARGRSLETIREDGLTIEEPDGTVVQVMPAATESPEEVGGGFDVVLFCVKSYDTDGAAALVARMLSEDGKVVCLQNGVRNEQVLAEVLGPERILPAVLYIGSQRMAPGRIRCTSPARITVGPYVAGDEGPSAAAVAALFVAAGVECTVEDEILAAKWQKFLFNCGLNPLTSLTRQRLGRILELPEAAAVFFSLVDEAHAAASAAGAPLPPDAKSNVAATARRMDISSSMAEDLAARRPIELDAFTGFVIELGETHGVATPTTSAIHGTLVGLSDARLHGPDH